MIIVPLKEGENIERALKKFKRKLSESEELTMEQYNELKSLIINISSL